MKLGIRRVCAGMWLVWATGACGAVQAQGLNLYSGSTSVPTIPFLTTMSSGGATLSLSLGNTSPGNFVLDTGSNGILVSSDNFNTTGLTPIGTGTETLTSSGITYTGNLYQTTVAINVGSGRTATAAATANVTVLEVLKTTTCSKVSPFTCTSVIGPTGISYMGVGFNRGVSTVTPDNPSQVINTNPFINIVSIGSNPTVPATGINQGYIITNSGVTLGLTSSNTGGYALVKLTPDANPSPSNQPGTTWGQAPVVLSVGGISGPGTLLPDAGIPYAFLTPPVYSGQTTCPTAPQPACLPSTVPVVVYLPGQANPLATYTLTAAGSPLAPTEIALNPPDPTATFLNTGRGFYQGFDYLYDPTNGFVGYSSVSLFATVNAGLALIGNVSLQNGFTDPVPTFLFGATTLLQTGTGTISGVIAGAGSLTIGSGTVNLTGANTYTGGTSVTGGATLGLLADTGLGDPTGGLTLANGTLQALGNLSIAHAITLGGGGGTFDTNNSQIAVTNPIGGPGGLTKQGAGTLVLSGINTYTGGTTVNGGTLQMAAGAALAPNGALTINSGTFDLNNNNMTIGPLSGTGGTLALGSGTLTVNTVGNSTLASVVTGSGGLNVQGSGSLALTGANTFTGGTAISSGRLAVNGNLTSNVSISGSGMLGGNGTITGNVANGGIVAPGNSIGTLAVVGSYSQTAGSTYQAEVNGQGASDRVNVSGAPGTATIAGSVLVLPQAGSYAPKSTYAILNATGGVTGTYSSVASSLPFLQPSLSYDANNVYLNLQIGGFAAAAQTPTQAAVGAVLDATAPTATGNYAAVLGALSTLTAQQGQAVMTSISGQNYAGFATAGVQTSQLFMSNFTSQVGGGSGGSSRVALAQACDVSCDTASPSVWGAWGGAIGGLGTIGANAPVGGLTYNLGGFAAGLDRKVTPDLLLGVTLGYTTGTQWVSGFQGSGISSTIQTGLYGTYGQGPVYLDALAGYAYSDNQMWRPILIPGLAAMTAQGRAGANQFYGQLETGYRVDIGGAAQAFVTPFARLQGSTSTQNGFSESGASSLNLSVATQTTNSVRSVFGAQLGGAIDMGLHDKLAMKFRLGWSHEYADTGRPVTAAFAGAPAVPFTTNGISPQRDGIVIGLSANTAIAEATSIYFRYEGDLSGQDSSHALTAGVRMTW